MTDLPIRFILDHTEHQTGTRGILGAENSGPDAQLADAMKSDERINWAFRNVTKVYPQFVNTFEGGLSVVWQEEPWSHGGLAFYGPGEMTAMFPHVASIEGRVHFAGEHTSTLFVIEGAVQSGVRAAREVAATLR